MTKKGKRIGILTGGGDCPGLNPAIRGAVIQAAGSTRRGWRDQNRVPKRAATASGHP